MSTTVHVKDISSQTTENEVREFFTFCGKINSLSVTPTSDEAGASKSATVIFEKEGAAKTALLLDSTQLGPAQVHVTSAASLDDLGAAPAGTSSEDKDEIEQEDKPRSRILAEYLAHGYTVSDKAIERAIQLDNQHGVTHNFLQTLKSLDSKFKATEHATAVDSKLGLTEKGHAAWAGLSSYFDKALGTPTGQKLRSFYETGNKQVMDVHNEARHLANLKAGKFEPEAVEGSTKTTCGCAGGIEKCGCAAGSCACNSCAKNTAEVAAARTETAEKSEASTEKPAA